MFLILHEQWTIIFGFDALRSGFQSETVERLEYLKVELFDVKRLLLQVISTSSEQQSNAFENSALPLTCKEELVALEAKIVNHDNFNQLVSLAVPDSTHNDDDNFKNIF
jgi:hypothetical protein